MSFGGQTIVCSYNGITFDERLETLSFDCRPVEDGAGRTVKYVVTSLRIRTIYTANDAATADTAMADLRQRLTSQGRDFYYQNAGLGNITINVSGPRDVVWGPKPRLLSFRPLSTHSCEIVWHVDVAVPECNNAVYQSAFMEFCFRLAFEVDKAGYTSRVYSGYYAIPQTRSVLGRQLNDSADNYWSQVQAAVPTGHQRTVNRRELSEDKCRMDFQFVDNQVGPNYLPIGVVDCQASHGYESGMPFARWVSTIRADYTLAADARPEICVDHFKQLVRQRADWTRLNGEQANQQDPNGNKNGVGTFIQPLKWSFAEPDIYGRPQASFYLQYVLTQRLENIFKASGLWLPTATNWDLWQNSLQDSAGHPRGSSRLAFNFSTDDAIVDLCLASSQARFLGTAEQPALKTTGIDDDFSSEPPDKRRSWINYRLELESKKGDGVLEHKPLPTDAQPPADPGNDPQNPDYWKRKVSSAPDSLIQRRTDDSRVFYLKGWALRSGYDIPPPSLVSVNDQPLTRANRTDDDNYFVTWQVGNFDVPLIAAAWCLRFIQATVKGGEVAQGISAPGSPGNPKGDKQQQTVETESYPDWPT